MVVLVAVASGAVPGRFSAALGRVADVAGKAAGRALTALTTVPGLAGAAMISYGAAMIYLPAGVITGGAFLLLLDRRL